jgi:hypothetical protein
MNDIGITQRQFILSTVALTGSSLLTSCGKKSMLSAADQVTLGKTGLRLFLSLRGHPMSVSVVEIKKHSLLPPGHLYIRCR